jgi:hypothetical protein
VANETLEREADETLERECVHFPMRVQPVTTRVQSAASLTALAKERAPDASVFDDAQPHIFTGIASTPALDSWFTHMERSSLENFAADMAEGVPLQNSHDSRRLGLGKSLTGRFVRGKGDLPTRTEGEFYFLPDSEIGGINTDDLMRNIRAGVITDLSVGFYGGRWLCDLCGEDYIRGACPHWLGMEYTPEDGGAKQVATAAIHDARLAEVSVVYSGSTPGAAIQKVIRAVDEGLIEPEKLRVLEACYRVKLPGSRHIWAAPDIADSREETPMADKPNETPAPAADVGVLQAWQRTIHQALTDIGLSIEDGKEPATLIRAMGAELTELRPLKDKVAEQETRIAELEPRAKDGDLYRTALVDETWGEYVRAGLSDGVTEEEQKALWARSALPQVVKERDHYKKLGDARFAGGRLTGEGEQPTPAAMPLPLHLYAV